jgi:dynein heavy chain
MRSNVEKLSDINKLVEEYKLEAEQINRDETLLAWEVTPFPKLHEIMTAKDPYEKLWNTAWHFYTSHEQWMNGAFKGLNAEEISDEVRNKTDLEYRTDYHANERILINAILKLFKVLRISF